MTTTWVDPGIPEWAQVPIECEAIVWDGSNLLECIAFCGSTLAPSCWSDIPAFQLLGNARQTASVWTQGHWQNVYPGDVILAERRTEGTMQWSILRIRHA